MADNDSAITIDQPVIDAPQPDPVPIITEPASPPDIMAESPAPAEPTQESQPMEALPQTPEPTTPSPQPTPAPEPSPPATPPTAQDPVQAPPPEPLATPTSEPSKVSDMPPAPIPEPVPQLSPVIPQPSDNDIVNSLTDEQLKMAAALYAKKNQKALSRKGVEARQAVAQINVADILAFVASHSPANNRTIARALNLPPRRVQHYMQQLTHNGSVTATGWGISREYRIK